MRYLTHPQVDINAEIPVPQWSLSDVGRQRSASLASADWLSATTRIVASCETKAIECAEIIGEHLGLAVEKRQDMHENDRSSTGFLAPDAFETMADAFFRHPSQSIKGWERAVDASARIVAELSAVLETSTDGDLLIVGHGAVGTLLYCHLSGLAIDRAHDQPAGGGNYFSFSPESLDVAHGWLVMEMAPGQSHASSS